MKCLFAGGADNTVIAAVVVTVAKLSAREVASTAEFGPGSNDLLWNETYVAELLDGFEAEHKAL